jgi:hypothetical protein
MSALSIQVPFPVFQGRDGQPLENGYVWIGEPNLNPQTNPVVAYYDAALTIPAAQPLRTLNGYVSRAGTPAQIYVDGVNFSILVQDSKGSMVYNFPDGTGISPNADGIVYDPPFTGGVSTTVEDKLAQTVSVKDFGAVGDGVADDTAAIQLALNASNHIFFPAGTYSLGSTSGGVSIFTIDAGGDAFSIKTDGTVKFTVTSASTSNGDIFKITNANGVVIDDLEAHDLGFAFATQTGVAIVNLAATSGKPVTNVAINSLRGYNVTAALRLSGLVSDRVSNVNIGAIYCDTCFYGVNAMYQGDNVNIDALYFNNGQRSLFVYGTRGVTANIYSTAARAGSSDVLISAFSDQLTETQDVKVNYTCRAPVNLTALVLLSAFGETSKVINNISIHYDVESTTNAEPFAVRAFNAAGTVENTGATNNVWTNIFLSGRIEAATAFTWFNIYPDPTTKGYLNIADSLILSSTGASLTGKIGANIRTYFRLWGGGSFTPVLTGTSAAGAGTYTTQTGQYYIQGDRLFFDISLTWTAHTGTGSFVIDGLPVNCRTGAPPGICSVFYNNYAVGAGYQMGAAVPTGPQVILYQMDPAGGTVNLLPVDSAATLRVSGSYLI